MNNQLNRVSPIQKGKDMNTNNQLNQASPERNGKKMNTNNESTEVSPKRNGKKRSSAYASNGVRWNKLMQVTCTGEATARATGKDALRSSMNKQSEFWFHVQLTLACVKQLYDGGDRHCIEEIIALAQRRLLHLQAELGGDLTWVFRAAIMDMLKNPRYSKDDIVNLVCYEFGLSE
jgi:hypothetical protein